MKTYQIKVIHFVEAETEEEAVSAFNEQAYENMIRNKDYEVKEI